MTAPLELLKQRTSANNFDKAKKLTEAEIKELVSYTCEAPSSFNVQPWRLIAVNDKSVQEKLKAASFNQAKVADAAATFESLGDLRGIDKLSEAIAPMLKAGAIDQAAHDGWLNMANGMYYKDNPLNRAIKTRIVDGKSPKKICEQVGD